MRAPGVLEAFGTVRAGAYDIGRLAERYTDVDLAGIEDSYSHRNRHTAKVLARISGRWQQAFEHHGVATTFVAAKTWQHAILSLSPRAKRDERKAAAKAFARSAYGVKAPTEDEADSICLATYLVSVGVPG